MLLYLLLMFWIFHECIIFHQSKVRLSARNLPGNTKQQAAERGELCLNKAPLHTPWPCLATR